MAKKRPEAPTPALPAPGEARLWIRLVEETVDALRDRIAELVEQRTPAAEAKVRQRAHAERSALGHVTKPIVAAGRVTTFRGTTRDVAKVLRNAGLPRETVERAELGVAAFLTRVWPYLVTADPTKFRVARRKYARALLEFYEESASLFGGSAAAAALPAEADLCVDTWALPVAHGAVRGVGAEPPVPLDGWIRLQGAMLLKQYGVPLDAERVSGLVIADSILGLRGSRAAEIHRTYKRNSKKAQGEPRLAARLVNLRTEYELLAQRELLLPTRDVV